MTTKLDQLHAMLDSMDEYERYRLLCMAEIEESRRENGGVPIIECERTESGLAFDCPYCEVRHVHSLPDDAGGHRLAHCKPGSPLHDGGYVLVPIEGTLPRGPQKPRRRGRKAQ
ncbi:hypothetical protein [Chelativorans xinjiangense]|uniref:hypothetical protein n=1 Tax=Chelativorans xinjiangense TaxID=2681485 RepID=UPI00135C636C|nr:hypothetical protein [Chelativorans xinjiangense]